MIDHVRSISDGIDCPECWQKMELVGWEWDVYKPWDDLHDGSITLKVRFMWKCPECGEELTKYTTVGHLV